MGEGQWNTGHGDIRITLLLKHPRAIDEVLPYEDWTGDASLKPPARCIPPRYVTGWLRVRTHNLAKVWISVDTIRRRVVAIQTAAETTVFSYAPGKPHPWCPQDP